VTKLTAERMRENVAQVRARIEAAAKRAGRDPKEIALVGVSKVQPLASIYQAMDCGISIFGENRVQEREEKREKWNPAETRRPAWHMIGHLQRNKARRALELFDCIQSVDGIELAETLQRILGERETMAGERSPYPIYVEVNTSGEASKHGVAPQACPALVEDILERCGRLSLRGLMTVGPLTEDEAAIRRSFAMLRDLSETLRAAFPSSGFGLSMGMSGDFETAIEEGSTLVRVGTGIFGPRG
jgi:pyridoxal phosphate enzyme, YggS family